MNFDYYKNLCGNRRVSIKLSTLFYLKDLLDKNDIAAARELVDTACAADERHQLRIARENIWRKLNAARASGDERAIAEYCVLLEEITQAQKLFSV